MSVSRIGRGNRYGIGEDPNSRQRITLLSPRAAHSRERILGCSNIGVQLSNPKNKLSHNLSPLVNSMSPPKGCTWDEALDLLENPNNPPKLPKKMKLPNNVTMEERLIAAARRGHDKQALAQYKKNLPASIKQRYRRDQKQRMADRAQERRKQAEDAWQTELIERWRPPPTPASTPAPNTPTSTANLEILEADASGRVLSEAEQTHAKRKDSKQWAMLAQFVDGAAQRGVTVQKLFEELDTDGSGQLTANELHAAFERLGLVKTRDQVSIIL